MCAEVRDNNESTLRDRVKKLSLELDGADARLARTSESCRQAILALAGMTASGLGRPEKKALKALKKAAKGKVIDHKAMTQATTSLKNAFMDGGPKKGAKSQAVEVAQDAEKTSLAEAGGQWQAGRHVALALLEGLRLGDKLFDARLERDLLTLQRHMDGGQVRPAMALVVDLLGAFRESIEVGRKKAETALYEVLSEVLKTEENFSEAFDASQSERAATGRKYNAQLNSTMGNFGRDLKDATDLDTLKASALTHLRGMRQSIKAREAEEADIAAQSQKEMEELRDHLVKTRAKMEEVKQVSQQLSKDALTDALTGLWNKRALDQVLGEELEKVSGAMSLIVFDIDHFKNINDTYGHQAGDKALIAVGQRAGQALRDTDTLFRYAGDEFVIILRGSEAKTAQGVAERVRELTESIAFTFKGKGKFNITLSLGVGQYIDGDDAVSLFERVDGALYQAKESGRNRVAVA